MTHTIQFPCLEVLMVQREMVVANDYNPNHVSPEKMQLLMTSIIDNGFCFPIVTIWDEETEKYIIIDGFHRRLIAEAEWLDIKLIPIVVLKHDITKRMFATVQFNKARGVHQVDLDADLVRKLLEQGLAEESVAEKLQIDLETVHRYKQLTGIASLFAKAQYSLAWEMTENGNKKD